MLYGLCLLRVPESQVIETLWGRPIEFSQQDRKEPEPQPQHGLEQIIVTPATCHSEALIQIGLIIDAAERKEEGLLLSTQCYNTLLLPPTALPTASSDPVLQYYCNTYQPSVPH